MLGVHGLYDGDMCVIDCGTAVTLDVITSAGEHRGGAITPGLAAMRGALGTILPGLPEGFPLPVLIVRHLGATAQSLLEVCFDRKCDIHVKEAEDKEPVRPGVAHVAPGAKRMGIGVGWTTGPLTGGMVTASVKEASGPTHTGSLT